MFVERKGLVDQQQQRQQQQLQKKDECEKNSTARMGSIKYGAKAFV